MREGYHRFLDHRGLIGGYIGIFGLLGAAAHWKIDMTVEKVFLLDYNLVIALFLCIGEVVSDLMI